MATWQITILHLHILWNIFSIHIHICNELFKELSLIEILALVTPSVDHGSPLMK